MNGLADGLQSLFRASKDVALALSLRHLLNSKLQAFGQVVDVSLDTSRRRVQLRLALHGETMPIDVDVRRYEIEHIDGRDCLTVLDVVASRAWLTSALQLFVVGRRFPLPPTAAAVARLLI